MIDLPYVPTGSWWTRWIDLWQTVTFNLKVRADESDDDGDFYDDIDTLIQ